MNHTQRKRLAIALTVLTAIILGLLIAWSEYWAGVITVVPEAKAPTVGDVCDPRRYVESHLEIWSTGQNFYCNSTVSPPVWAELPFTVNELNVKNLQGGLWAHKYADSGSGTEASPWTGWEDVLDDAAACIKAAGEAMPNCLVNFTGGVFEATSGAFSDYVQPPFGYVQGLQIQGSGMYNTIIRPDSTVSEFWFYDNCLTSFCVDDVPADNTACDSDDDCIGIGREECYCKTGDNRLIVPTFSELSFQGASPQSPNGYGEIPQTINGFRIMSERDGDNNVGFTFKRVGFFMMDDAIRFEGTNQASETVFENCFFNKLTGDLLYINNEESLNTQFIGTSAETLYSNGIVIGTVGGGAVSIWGGSWILSRPDTCDDNPTGTHNGGDASANLIDTTTDFVVDHGVQVGDFVINWTEGSWFEVATITTTTNPNDTLTGTLADGVTNLWSDGDDWLLAEDDCPIYNRGMFFRSNRGGPGSVNNNRFLVSGVMFEFRDLSGLLDTHYTYGVAGAANGSSINLTLQSVRYLTDSAPDHKVIGVIGPNTNFSCIDCNHREQSGELYYRFTALARGEITGTARFVRNAVPDDFSTRFLWDSSDHYGRAICDDCWGPAGIFGWIDDLETREVQNFDLPPFNVGYNSPQLPLKRVVLKSPVDGWPFWSTNFDTSASAGPSSINTGGHDGPDDSADLIDATAEFVTWGARVGDTIVNSVDGSSGPITAVAETQLTATLAGGDNDWDIGDTWTLRRCGSEKVVLLPAGSVIMRVAAYKPAGGTDTSDYQIRITDGDKATEYGESFEAAQNVAHWINVEDMYIDVGTDAQTRRVRLSCENTNTAATENITGGWAWVEYH